MSTARSASATRIVDATRAVFGDAPVTVQVETACERFERELEQIHDGRGIESLLIAVVGAKGQGKTWTTKQFLRSESIRSSMRSGDLVDDATTRLVWVGPVAPTELDPTSEIYHPCRTDEMVSIGQPYVILDTPGITDANHRAANLAKEALALAPIKILVIARDQIRAAANLSLATQIDGSICIPLVSSVEPEEMPNGENASILSGDLRSLLDQLGEMAPRTEFAKPILVPDFEISNDEADAGRVAVSGVLDRLSELGLTKIVLGSAKDRRIAAAGKRLRRHVSELIKDELPQLAEAVTQLNRETEKVPQRVLDSLLGSETVLETGVRMRLRARLVADTSLLWFPYRTVMSTLNLTQGAWDRVMLALAGSVPSLFGALSSMAKNVRENRDFNTEMKDGIRKRTQEQVEERLRPLCNHFHRTVVKLRPRAERVREEYDASGIRLAGVEELQTRSQQIFDAALDRNRTNPWLLQFLALVGVAIFWGFMAGPIVLIYREYFFASVSALTGGEANLDTFPHPTPSLLFTSLFLSMLPLAIYCMAVLTLSLTQRKVKGVAREIIAEHNTEIDVLRTSNVIRLDFEDELLSQAEYLINLQDTDRS
ncbi:MAG: hypothetical protein ACE361_19815 [Aureliella sp.]